MFLFCSICFIKMKEFSNFFLPVKYFKDVCRVCLSKHEILIPIRDINLTHNLKPNGSAENVSLKVVFQKFCNVEVDFSDKKPQKICEFCLNMVGRAFNFFQLFLYSNALLDRKLEEDKLYQKISKKSEGDSDNTDTVAQIQCTSGYITSKKNTISTNFASEVTSEPDSDNIITATKSISSVCALPITQISEDKHTPQERKKPTPFKYPPEKWLDPNGCIDPIKEGALKILLKIKNKVQPAVRSNYEVKSGKKVVRPSKTLLRQLEHQNNIFRCRLCQNTYHDITEVVEHLKDQHADTRRCILCTALVGTDQGLFYHVTAHSPKGLVCRICRLYFKSQDTLDKHNEIIDHTNIRKCPKCDKTFRSPWEARHHIATVHLKNQNGYQCKHCGKFLKYSANLRRHELAVHGNKRFLCQICGKGLTTYYAVRIHMQKVHKINQGLTIKRYKYPVTRGEHEQPRRPRGWKPMKPKFECQFCPKKFYNSYVFLIHSEVHPEFKDYRCEGCNEVLETRQQYLSHSETHAIYKCLHVSCIKKFPTKKAALLHKYTHRKAFRCNICNLSFRIKNTLEAHMNVHTGRRPYMCDKCGLGFKQKTHLGVHMSQHGEKKPGKCKFCDKTFSCAYSLKAHMRSHKGEKPFPCPYCTKMFRDTVSRHKHVKKDHPRKINDFLVYKENHQAEEILKANQQSEKTYTENIDNAKEQ